MPFDMRFFSTFVLAVLSAACVDSPTAPDDMTGVWGGEHARLTILEDGGEFEFDCAHVHSRCAWHQIGLFTDLNARRMTA